jgi:predicted membrane-bound spermidine synthase
MTNLAQSHPLMLKLNKYLPSQNYQIHNRDAIPFIEEQGSELHKYRYIVIDFPVMISPVADEVKKFGLERFFSKEMFIDIILRHMNPDGLITMQADDTFVHSEHKRYFENLLE